MTKKKHATRKKIDQVPKCTIVALVIVADDSKIRRTLLTKYRQRVKTLKVDSDKLRRYQEVDNPDFTQWLDLEFGEARTHLLKAQMEVSDIRSLVTLIQDYATIMEVPLHKAHRVITSAKANDRLDSVIEILNEELRARAQREAEDENWDDEDEDEESQQARDPHSEHDFHGEGQPPPERKTRSRDKNENVKTLYRQLVRLLHPDLVENQTPEQARLWHDVQKAYQWEDLEKLESILKSLQGTGEAVVDYKTMPLGEILALQKSVERRLEQIRSQINKMKKEPDWNFTDVKNDAKKMRYLKRDLQYTFDVGIVYANREHKELKDLLFRLSLDPRDRQRAHNLSQRIRIEDLFR